MYYGSNKLVNHIYTSANNVQQRQLIEQQQEMMREKQLREMRIVEKMNEIKKMDGKKLANLIIPSEIIKKPNNEQEFNSKYMDMKREYEPSLLDYWNKRTNLPYKNILKNEDYTKSIKSSKDLIVYKINLQDKSSLTKELKELMEKIDQHNKELKESYTTDNEEEHKKDFEYNNKYIFRIKYDPKNAEELKEESLDEYKKKQEELDKGRKRVDEILESLIDSGVIVKEENIDEIIKKEQINKTEEINKSEEINKIEEKQEIILDEPKEKLVDVREKYRRRQLMTKTRRV